MVNRTDFQCFHQNSQVRFGSTVDWNCPQFSAHTQVLSDHSREGYAGDIDEPPGQGGWGVSVVDPASNQVEEVHGNGKVKALFPSTDEKPQTEGTVTAMKLSAVFIHLALNPCDQNLVKLKESYIEAVTGIRPKKERNILPCQRVQDKRHHGKSALHGCKTKDLENKIAFQHVYTCLLVREGKLELTS